MPAVPADPYALARLPVGNVRADGIDTPGDFVAGNPGILQPRPEPILDHDIAVADPAGLHFDAHLPVAGLRDRALDQLELPAGLAHLHRLHQSHVLSSPSRGGRDVQRAGPTFAP